MKIIKKVLTWFFAFTLASGIVPQPMFAAENGYPDVPQGHWASRVIAKWSSEAYGVLEGNADGTFAPSRELSLGELAAVLSRIFGYIERAPAEVAPAWADEAVEKAIAAGLITEAGEIDASVTVTREQAARYIALAYEIAPAPGDTAFADDSAIDPACKPYVNALQKRGCVAGKGGGLFDPKAAYTRAEAVTLLDNTASEITDRSLAGQTYAKALIVRKPGLTIAGTTVGGDLIVGQGVGDGGLKLDGVKIGGALIVRGGGEGAIRVEGSEPVTSTLADKPYGEAVHLSGDFDTITVAKGTNPVLTGKAARLVLLGDNAVTLDGATVGAVEIRGENVKFTVKNGSAMPENATTGSGASAPSAGGDEAAGAAQKPETEAQGPGSPPARFDNLNDDVIDLGDIEELVSSGTIEVVRAENGDIHTIDGPFTQRTVRSANDAATVLNAASALFGGGFRASAADIEIQTLRGDGEAASETFYRYSASVGGVPVFGSQIILATGAAGDVQGLFGSYDGRVSETDTVPTITAADASGIATAALLSEEAIRDFMSKAGAESAASPQVIREAFLATLTTETDLLVYAADESESPALMWTVALRTELKNGNAAPYAEKGAAPRATLVYVDRSYFIFANGARKGEIYTVLSGMKGDTATANDLAGNARTFNVEKKNGKYYLRDTDRGIETYETAYGGPLWLMPQVPGEPIRSNNNTDWPAAAVSAHTSLATVYDYYKNVLGRDSYDGYGATVKCVIEYDKNAWLSGEYENAFWNGEYIYFGNGERFSKAPGALDIVGHEFTHGVIEHAVYFSAGPASSRGLIYKGESGALNEAYADILGSLIEGKTDSDRWWIGEDNGYAFRSLARPALRSQPEHYSKFYTGSSDYGGVHTNSGIFNFASYKMMTDSRTSGVSNETWARVFYRSLFRLSPNANFLDARGAVIATAKILGFTGPQQQAVKDAFDAVGIAESSSIRIVLRWGETPRDLDSHLVGPATDEGSAAGKTFHIYFNRRSYHTDNTYDSDSRLLYADLDYDDATSYGPEITTIQRAAPGEYRFFVHDYANHDKTASAELAASGANVKVYRGSSATPAQSFDVNPASEGTLWCVFKLAVNSDGDLSVSAVDAYSYSNDPSTIGI
jgi:Zn-dependent metalloprotease